MNRRAGALERDLTLATELIDAAECAADVEPLIYGRIGRMSLLLERGDIADADREAAALLQLSERLRQPVWSWLVKNISIMKAIRDGRFDDAEREMAENLKAGEPLFGYAAASYFAGESLLLCVLRGRGQENLELWRAIGEAHPEPEAATPTLWAESELGDPERARRGLARLMPSLGRRADTFQVLGASFLAATCMSLDDTTHAAVLYDHLEPYRDRWVQWADAGALWPVALLLGGLARVQERWDEGAAHFDAAIAATTESGARPFAARAQYEYARLLRSRGVPGDAKRAGALLAASAATAEEIGMDGLRARIAALAPTGTVALKSAAAANVDLGGEETIASGFRDGGEHRRVFRREGDYWTIEYGGTTIRIHDMRGLQYLSVLLRDPGREIHASELVADRNGAGTAAASADGVRVASSLGDAGPVVDATARAAYRRRVVDLREELEDAEGMNDLGRAERARAEIAALSTELVAAARRPGAVAHSERARLAVTKSIKTALTRIAARHPELGAHLDATIRRGYLCIYQPDPSRPVTWET